MNKIPPVVLALISAALLWLAWPPFHTGFLAFIAFVPFLFMLDKLMLRSTKQAYSVVVGSYFFFLLWNTFTTWWIWFASPSGALMAIILNALLMTLPIFFYYRVRLFMPKWVSYVALVCFWLVYEYLHFNWDAPWPWLAIGNVFAANIDLVQWYEFTGIFGGTIWVLVINILLYEWLLRLRVIKLTEEAPAQNQSKYIPIAILLLFVIPIGISYVIKPDVSLPQEGKNIVAVQPNIDPYNEKFDRSTLGKQINILIDLSEKGIDSNTVLVLWPETAIAEELEENHILYYESINAVRALLKRHPNVQLVAGSTTMKVYESEADKSSTARKFTKQEAWYDMFNAAIFLDSSQNVEVYHKSKLVPGVERMPYPFLFGFLEDLAIDLGGTSGSLGEQPEPSVFKVNEELTVAPVICYESVFGEYVTRYIDKGANLIAIITNDGWWDNSPGYKQHLMYGALRAVETRLFIARSANTGISAFILPNGETIKETGWWEPAVIKSTFITSEEETFYTLYGDYLARIALYAGAVFLLIAFFGKWLPKT